MLTAIAPSPGRPGCSWLACIFVVNLYILSRLVSSCRLVACGCAFASHTWRKPATAEAAESELLCRLRNHRLGVVLVPLPGRLADRRKARVPVVQHLAPYVRSRPNEIVTTAYIASLPNPAWRRFRRVQGAVDRRVEAAAHNAARQRATLPQPVHIWPRTDVHVEWREAVTGHMIVCHACCNPHRVDGSLDARHGHTREGPLLVHRR